MSIADPRRFHRPDPQQYALDQARDRHTEVLYRRGEYAMFVLMWDVFDFEAGRVVRCRDCVDSFGDDVTAAFGGQSAESQCESCLGTGFEGGWKAKIIRPSLWDATAEPDEDQARRGTVERQFQAVQTTFDFRLNRGDYVLRADGSRWYARAPRGARLSTGFETAKSLGFNYATVERLPTTHVAFKITPEPAALIAVLAQGGHGMVDFSAYERIREGVVLV